MKLLIIEDSDSDYRFIMRALCEAENFAFEARRAEDLAQAEIALFEEKFDALLADLNLPDSSGLDTFNKLQEKCDDKPIIILSGNQSEESALKALAAGAQDYLFKNDLTLFKERLNSRLLVKTIKFALQRKKNELRMKEVSASKDKFLSIIAHDIKNPISVFLNISYLLSEGFDEFDTDESKQFIFEMYRSAQQLYDLIENLLDWSMAQSGKIECLPKSFDFGAIARSVVSLLKFNAIEKKVKLYTTIDRPIEVYADLDMTKTILRNLCSNAIKFSSANGEVVVGARRMESEMEIFVSDQGCGISEEEIRKLFDSTTPNRAVGEHKEKGAGLGLVICKEFVEKSGGELRVESAPGKGSTFYFTLPNG